MSKLESQFQRELIKKILDRFPGAFVLKNDPEHVSGIPDLTVFYRRYWCWLEVKRSKDEPKQPNQYFYIGYANDWALGAFVHPDNVEEVLDVMERAFQADWGTCLSQPE